MYQCASLMHIDQTVANTQKSAPRCQYLQRSTSAPSEQNLDRLGRHFTRCGVRLLDARRQRDVPPLRATETRMIMAAIQRTQGLTVNRSLIFGVLLCVSIGPLGVASEHTPAWPPSPNTPSRVLQGFGIKPAREATQCCKICTRGKACGNTCIAQDKQCHVGPGCACNG